MPGYISKDDAYRHFDELQEKHMKRAEKVKEKIPDYYERSLVRMNEVIDAKSFILCMPAADVAPVVHGKWIFKEKHRGGIKLMTGTDAYGNEHTIKVDCRRVVSDPYCSICGQLNEAVFLNYCPNCGAKMQNEE